MAESRFRRDGGDHSNGGRAAHSSANRAKHAGAERAVRGANSPSASRAKHFAPSRAEGAGAYAERRQAKKRRNVALIVVACVLSVILAGGTAVALYLGDINSRLSSGLSTATRDLLSDTITYDDPFYMLLLGVDKSEERVNSAEYGADESNYRADSIILARIDAKSQKVTLISLHRDTMTDMSDMGAGTQKLNAAYSLGGPEYMIKCVEKLAGVDISHYAEVDFEEFAGIVDTIGGVDVNLPIDVKDSYSGADLTAGEHTLNGTEALALCRSRHAYDDYGDGDLYRAANQRMVIAAIVKKVLALDVTQMPGVVSQMASGVTTDLNVSDIIGLGTQFRNLDVENDVYSGMEPTEGYYVNQTWYEKLDESAWKTMMERVDAGQAPLAEGSDSRTDTSVVGTFADGSTISSSSDEDDDASTSGASGSSDSGSGSTAAEYSGTVAVLNGAGVQGLAGTKATLLENKGFDTTATNSPTSETTTVVYYNGSAAKAKAVGAAESLGLAESSVKQNDGTWTANYDVVVVLGTDQA